MIERWGTRSTPLVRRVVCAFAALGVILCGSLMLASTPAGMHMGERLTTSAAAAADTGHAAVDAVSTVSGSSSDTIVGMGCEGTCALDTTVVCSAAALATSGILLLLVFRRFRHLALAARASLIALRRSARDEPPPWSVSTLSQLCVLRV